METLRRRESNSYSDVATSIFEHEPTKDNQGIPIDKVIGELENYGVTRRSEIFEHLERNRKQAGRHNTIPEFKPDVASLQLGGRGKKKTNGKSKATMKAVEELMK